MVCKKCKKCKYCKMVVSDTKTENVIYYYFECTKYNVTGDTLKELNENVEFEKSIN